MHVVVISGGGTGIGLASVRYFARRNAQVVIIGRRGAVLNEAVQAVRREFPEAPEVLALPGDLAAPGQVESICKDLSERLPIVDWLAGFARGRARDRASYSGQRRCRARPLIGSHGVSAASYRYQCDGFRLKSR